MSEIVTIELPDELARRARSLAERGNQSLETAAVQWIATIVAETSIESLGDAELLALCDAEFGPGLQDELSELLSSGREGALDSEATRRLNDLMNDYRRGLINKARAWKEAVARGLRPPLSSDAA
jgi:predicted transcriptional regulator